MKEILKATETLQQCPLCASSSFFTRFSPDICKCRQCAILFRNPRPNQADIFRSYNQGATFQQWQKELEARSFLWKKRLALVSSYQQSGTLLDVGTGDGCFLNFAKKQFDVCATEVSSAGISYAKALGHQVHEGTVFDSFFDNKKFDVITIWHVLEHVDFPGEFLKRIKELLAKGGFLFVAVPNELGPLCRPKTILMRSNPFPELRVGEEIHLTHFTPHSLKNHLTKNLGFSFISLKVDDVHVTRSHLKIFKTHLNSMLSSALNTHFDDAMVSIFRLPLS